MYKKPLRCSCFIHPSNLELDFRRQQIFFGSLTKMAENSCSNPHKGKETLMRVSMRQNCQRTYFSYRRIHLKDQLFIHISRSTNKIGRHRSNKKSKRGLSFMSMDKNDVFAHSPDKNKPPYIAAFRRLSHSTRLLLYPGTSWGIFILKKISSASKGILAWKFVYVCVNLA